MGFLTARRKASCWFATLQVIQIPFKLKEFADFLDSKDRQGCSGLMASVTKYDFGIA